MQNLSIPLSHCNAGYIPDPTVFGATILALTATPVQNFTRQVPKELYFNHPSISVQGVDYCNVTVTYTHEGQNDSINVETWLPLNGWNGRLQALGGGGYIAGRFEIPYAGMAGALAEGYVSTTTDGGLGRSPVPDAWALNSAGNVDLYALQNFGSVSLNDQSIIAKDIIKSFYGRPAEYSYWNGCSQGGRQGFMLAQRYPEAYDGIAAAAPALNWVELIPSIAWAQFFMAHTGQFPTKCELDALTNAAVSSCDPLDGITDGLLSDPTNCTFDPFSMVGAVVDCDSTNQTAVITTAAATIANITWTGPRDEDGNFLWYGMNYQSQLASPDGGVAATSCNANGTCIGAPVGLGESWLQLFVKKDPKWNTTMIESVEEYARLFRASVQQYNSIIGTADADLSQFRDTGGKLVTFHGLADQTIPSKGTSDYYQRVMESDANPQEFFRYFEVPGLAHCAGGNGGQPTATFEALVDWVENGIAPETIPIKLNDPAGIEYERILCPYPSKIKLVFEDADPLKRESYECSA